MTPSLHKGLRIFVSHSSKDNTFGIKLVGDLRRKLGNDDAVWYDAAGGLDGGVTWWRKIVQELSERDLFLIVLSPDAMKSKWVLKELDMAMVEEKHIIPLLYRPCAIRTDLKPIQHISFLPPNSYESAFNELFHALELSIKVHKRKNVRQNGAGVAQKAKEQQWRGYDEAIAYYDQVLAHDPTNVKAYNSRARAYLALKQYEKAIADFDHVIQLSSNSDSNQASNGRALPYRLLKETYIRRGSAYYALKEYEKAISDYNYVIQLSPKHIRTYINRGLAYFALKEYEKAISDYDQALVLNLTNANAYRNRAQAYFGLKQYEKAITDYDHIIQLYPNSAKAYESRAQAYSALSNPTLQEAELIQSSPVTRSNLIINLPAKQPVTLSLREKEYRLLRTLFEHPEGCKEDELMKAGWGRLIARRTLRRSMSRLSKRLKEQSAAETEIIENNYQGYYSLHYKDCLSIE